MKHLLLLLLITTFISCNKSTENGCTMSSFLKREEWKFPDKIDNTIKERAKYAKALSITFNNSFDSTRFIISNVYALSELKEYPPAYYFKRDSTLIFVYTGLESYNKEGIVIPKEILESHLNAEDETKLTEPFMVKYSYFRLDSIGSELKTDTLAFNEFLPLKVIK